MQHQTCSELQGASARWTNRKRAPIPESTCWTSPPPRSSGLEKGSRCQLYPLRGGFLWAVLLLWALAVPGARGQLSEEQQETIVELHNYYRGQVSPSATAMMPLKWDSSLKVLAEGYAAKCIWNHNPLLEETGENLFAGTQLFDPRESMEKWFLEHLDFEYSNNSCPDDKMCGHYTQMVWADTHRVGCALHVCDTMHGLDFEKANFLVCNYYPAGNYEEERPYEEGDSCSRCPENLQKCQDNLCVSFQEEEGEEEDGEEEEGEEEEEVTPPPGTSGPSPPPAMPTTSTTPTHQDMADPSHPASQHPPIFLYTTTPPPSPQEEEGLKEEEGGEIEDKKEQERGRAIERGKEIANAAASSISTPVFLLSCLTVAMYLRL